MRILHQVLKKIYQDYAVFFPPAKLNEIQKINIQLSQSGLSSLPQDYIDFLMLTDGLFHNGLEMFSTISHERDKGAFFHRSIIQMHKLFSQNPNMKNKIMLAQAPEEFVLYDLQRKEYQLMDRYSYTVFLKFPNLLDVIYYYTKPVLDK